MLTAKISSKGQAVLPKEIRKHLQVGSGDTIGFAIDRRGVVTVRRVDALDAAFLRLATETFSDWNDPEAERAFCDL